MDEELLKKLIFNTFRQILYNIIHWTSLTQELADDLSQYSSNLTSIQMLRLIFTFFFHSAEQTNLFTSHKGKAGVCHYADSDYDLSFLKHHLVVSPFINLKIEQNLYLPGNRNPLESSQLLKILHVTYEMVW